jgi:PAS domain S-box-containing protein
MTQAVQPDEAPAADVDSLRRQLADLQQRLDVLQLALDNISDGVAVADEAGHLLAISPAAGRIVGLGPATTTPEQWSEQFGLYLPDKVTTYPLEQLPLIRAMRGEEVVDDRVFVRNAQHPEGIWLSVNARPLLDKDGSRRGGVAVFRDITEAAKAREALLAEQQFLEQLLLAHERDRQLMAYEIHDGLVQEITGALMHLESIRPQQFSALRDAESYETAVKLLREALDEGRRLISGLRPPILDELGIVAAIEYLVGEHVSQGVSAIRFNHKVQFERLPPLLEGTIFRITQEALTNIKRHSRAPSASVELTQKGDQIQLKVRDTGVGFDPTKIDRRRLGLRGIRERARLLGGRAVIDSAPGRGTKIRVELPLTHAVQLGQRRSTE